MRCHVLLTMITLAFLSSADVSQTGLAADADWTGWLGPDRNGWVTDFQPPTKWPAKLQKGWQVEVGSSNFTSGAFTILFDP